jgi:hypothetical protein
MMAPGGTPGGVLAAITTEPQARMMTFVTNGGVRMPNDAL